MPMATTATITSLDRITATKTRTKRRIPPAADGQIINAAANGKNPNNTYTSAARTNSSTHNTNAASAVIMATRKITNAETCGAEDSTALICAPHEPSCWPDSSTSHKLASSV